MRSEKVYHLTSLIQSKVEQLAKETALIQEGYQDADESNDNVK